MNSAVKTLSSFSIFNYSDYLSFLQDFVQHKKGKSEYWSLGAWAKRLKLSNSAVLTNIIKGRKPLTLELGKKMLSELNLSKSEQEYFLRLVDLKKETISENSRSLIENKLNCSRRALLIKNVDLLKFETIANPKYFLLREMTQLKHFENTVEWMQHHSRLHLNKEDILQSIETLLQVEIQSELFDVAPETTSSAIQAYHHHSLQNAMNALSELPLEKRHFGAVTVSITQDSYDKITKRIEEFRKEILSLYDCKNADMVCQLNLQFFPLTKDPSQ